MSKMTSRKGENNILVAYFSRSGNTRLLANQIHEKVGGGIFEIQPEKPYPADYDAAVKLAKEEKESGFRPRLKAKIIDIGSYGFVFLGYPIWWGTFPMPVATFLSDYDFSGKTIVPFCTNGGSGLGHSVGDIKRLCQKSTVLEGLAIGDSDAKNARNRVSKWLQKLEIK